MRSRSSAEDAVKRTWVSRLDLPEGVLNRRPDVRGLGTYVAPVAALRDLEAVVFGEEGIIPVAVRLFERGHDLFIEDVADPLKEEQREDVGLEVRRIDRAPQDICRLPEVRL